MFSVWGEGGWNKKLLSDNQRVDRNGETTKNKTTYQYDFSMYAKTASSFQDPSSLKQTKH